MPDNSFEQQEYILKRKMSNLNTATYIKKLVKIIYEKEKQIQNLKHTLKSKPSLEISSNQQLSIDPQLKNQLQETSHQLKSVNRQLLTMQGRIVELSIGLKEELDKNGKLEQEIAQLREMQAMLRNELECKNTQLQQSKEQVKSLENRGEPNLQNQQELIALNRKLTEQLNELKQQKVKQKYESVLISKQLQTCKSELKKRENESKVKQSELLQKSKENELLKNKFEGISEDLENKKYQIAQLNETITRLNEENANLCQQLESTNEMQQSQIQLLGQKLKDYKEFALEISHHIEASYIRYCSKASLRSSKKLIRQSEHCQTKFEAALHKMNQIQLWMDGMVEKVDKIAKDQEIPIGTLQNLSLIAQSFEEKLELCDLTARIEKQRMEMDENEQVLLNKLQKQCEKSYERQRSKVVELGELKQVLKMTKQVNRELMDEVNKNQHVINECRKILTQVIGNKSNPEFKAIKALLNISK